MTLKQMTERDCREWKLSAIDPHDRNTWRFGVRSAMCAVTWKGANCCGYCPCTCALIQNLMMTNFKYDSILDKFKFEHSRAKVRDTVAIFRKTLSSL